MWLCVLYSPPLILHWQLAFASPRSHYCMNVTECFVFPSLLLSLQMAFASPRLFGLVRGQNAPKMGSKWAYFTRLCTPNGLG